MAPRGARRGEEDEPQAFHQLGIRGRKTGVALRDTGERDEHGMQPLDDLLSSPEKDAGSPEQSEEDESGSEYMDIETSAGPGPRTVLKERQSLQHPIQRSRSPLKTSLISPARKNPNVEHISSPTHPANEDVDSTVSRKLDFGATAKGKRAAKTNGVNGTLHEEDVAEMQEEPEANNEDLLEESLQMVEAMGESSPSPELEGQQSEEAEEEEEPVIQPVSTKKGRGRPKAVPKPVEREPVEEESGNEEAQEEERAPKPRGRPTKNGAQRKQPTPVQQQSRKRKSPTPVQDENENGSPSPEPQERSSQAKKQRTKEPRPKHSKPAAKAKPTAKPEAPTTESRPRGRPSKKAKQAAAEVEDNGPEESFMEIKRGPPLPKARGLVSARSAPGLMTQTRSGRHSFKPLNWWRGEAVVKEDEELPDMFARNRFVMPTIKEIIRVPEELPPSKRAPRSKTKTKAKAKQRPIQEEEEELEEWEVNPGTVAGEVVIWEPEHELHPPAEDEPVQIAEEQIAISADAVQTKDIRDATFRFAKTLTMPFMGAGVVDLPPGAEKRPKNSRKMHMVFFVHYGKVLVTVNEAQFRISAGGMWFVPRGNYYSITNDYDNPSRIFFSQACEVPAEDSNPDATQMSTY